MAGSASMANIKASEDLMEYSPHDRRSCPDHNRSPSRSLGSGWVRCPVGRCKFTRFNPRGAKE